MSEALAAIIVLGVLWAIVTLLGHGTWVLVSLIARGAKGKPTSSPPPPTRKRVSSKEAALDELHRELEQYLSDGVVDWESFKALREAIKAQRTAAPGLGEAKTQAETAVAPAPVAEADAPATDDVILAVADESVTDGATVVAEPVVPVAPVVPVIQPAAPPAERVRHYAASRAMAAMEAAEPKPAPAPPKQREAISRLFAAFMEEKNIRWGELVGGLLIVGCSIALVISFWSEIAARPFLKFVLLGGVTAALFGVGLYTDRRWKIHTTSHGLLVIATLLVPLNFLAIAAFTQGAAANDALTLLGEAVSAAVFTVLVYLAGQIIAPGAAVPLVVGVIVPSLVQLVVRRWAEPAAPLTTLYALAAVPVASYVATTSLVTRRRAAEPELEEVDAFRWLAFLGMVSAASFFPLALLAWMTGSVETAIHRLSPLAVWCGVPALVTGLLFWQRRDGTKRGESDRVIEQPAKPLSTGVQNAGLTAGVLGAGIMAASVVAAWPEPAMLLPVAVMNVVAFTLVAFWFGIPAALVPAGLALAGAWLVAFHVARGNVGWTLADYDPMRNAMVSAASGRALVPLVGVFGMLVGMLRQVGRREDGRMIGLVAAISAAASLGLVIWFGFARADDPEGATWVLGMYALAALAAAFVVRRAEIVAVGAALLLLALVQGMVFRWDAALDVARPLVAALLAHATLMLVGMAVVAWRRGQWSHWWVPLRWWAAVSSVAAAALLIIVVPATATASLAWYAAWLAAVWCALAMLTAWDIVFVAAQMAALAAIFAGVVAAVETRDWYLAARYPWLDPWFVATFGIALAAYCFAFGVVRAVFARLESRRAESVIEEQPPVWLAVGQRLLDAARPGVDRLAEILLIAAFAAVAIYAVVPGVAQELAPLEAARGTATAVRVVQPIEGFEIAGIPHSHAAGQGACLFGASLLAVVLLGIWQRSAVVARALAVVGILAMACLLLAARWEPEVAVASALRWFSAAFFAVASVGVWLGGAKLDALAPATKAPLSRQMRDALVAFAVLVYVAMGAYVASAAMMRTSLPTIHPGIYWWSLLAAAVVLVVSIFLRTQSSVLEERRSKRLQTGRAVAIVAALGPLSILFTFAVARALDQHPIVGPDPASWFRRIGWDVTYGVPLAVIALAFVGHAIVYRSSGFACAAGLLANVVATIVVLMRLARGGGALDAAAWVTVAQVNALVAGAVAVEWLGAVRWSRVREPLLLVTQAALAAALCAVFLLPAAAQLAIEPANLLPWLIQAGESLGWIALGLAIVAAAWLNGKKSAPQWLVASFAALLVAIVALATVPRDMGDWLAYHTLLVGAVVAAWLVPVATAAINRVVDGESTDAAPVSWSAFSARVFGIASVILALRALPGDPASPWWSIGALAAISARNVWIAWREGGRGSMWIAAILSNLAVTIWWASQWTAAGRDELENVWLNVIAAAVMALVSVVVERRGAERKLANAQGLAFHRFAAWAIAIVLLLVAAVGLLGDLIGARTADVNWPLAWAAWGAAFVAAAACWWDSRARWPVACAYTVGLVAVGMYLDGLNLRAPMFFWALAMALSAYSLATSFLWSRRVGIAATLQRLGVPHADGDTETRRGQHWLIGANGLTAVAVVGLVALAEVMLPEYRYRMFAAYAIGAEAFAFALLARGAVRSPLQYTALVFGALFAVAFGWSWLGPDSPAPWLHRTVASIAALAATIVVYGIGFAKVLKRENEWTRAAERLVPVLAVIAAALLVVVLGIEVAAFAAGEPAPVTWPALVAVTVALIGLAAWSLVMALVPGRDPLGLSERGRTAYVYAAEVLGALTFLHIRVTMPWLFTGWFLQFWPLVVMAIAFLGVGLAEVFRRNRQNVLSEPLMTTGALLPLLPALGFWASSSEVHYSLVLLTVGVLYAAVSALRRSFWFAVLAALAANGSLWFLLHEQKGLSIAEHPQLWLIPPALCVLVAGWLNRERMSPEQSAALRYGSAIVIYASSTADIFINGVANAPWLPAVLAGLSIAGVFLGILLRVRAFLYLGVTFLMIAIMTIIWYAAVEQERTWILYLAGIVTGAVILGFFGVFEKRRDDVLRMVERMKQWEA